MSLKDIKQVYFIGIGGIGMSALARYFNFLGKKVIGYDRTRTTLTDDLEREGIPVYFEDSVVCIPKEIQALAYKDSVLVVYTPAISKTNKTLGFFFDNNFTVAKRSEVLGLITKDKKGIAIAGTHGKTSVTATTTHILKQSSVDCSAFLGGISKNYQTNFLFSDKSDFVVVEADEYDRSFHQLFPQIAIVTAMDADHLEIYGTPEAVVESFYQFMTQINSGGILIIKYGSNIRPILQKLKEKTITIYTYSLFDSRADFYAHNIENKLGTYHFDIVTPNCTIANISFTIPGTINIENAVAASAAALCSGATYAEIKTGLSSFEGVKRRFDFHLKTEKYILIDDYAHHPEEIRASISSIRDFYPDKRITIIFQPHLFSRTRDFADDFAKSLSLCDELLLLDIYPARELPIEGITSKIIFDKITISNKKMVTKENLLEQINVKSAEIIMTVGAGDVDNFCHAIKTLLINNINNKFC